MTRRVLASATLAAIFFSGATAQAGPVACDLAFEVLPPGGAVAGPAGTTVGWGYEISNTGACWLSPVGLDADVFDHGTPSSAPFDFPILAPGTSVRIEYDGVGGLFELAWDNDAPLGFENTGTFVLTAEFFTGDPLGGGQFVARVVRERPYSARVTAGSVPEPGLVFLMTLAGIAVAPRARRRWLRRG